MRILLIAVLLLSTSLFAVEDFDTHPVFGQLVGEWKGEGTMTNRSDGSQISISETWTSSVEADRVVMTGTRMFGDADQSFTWTITFNEAQELLEGRYEARDESGEQDLSLSVAVSEVDRSFTLSGAVSAGGPTITIVNTFSETGDLMTGVVDLIGDSADSIVEITMTHQKMR